MFELLAQTVVGGAAAAAADVDFMNGMLTDMTTRGEQFGNASMQVAYGLFFGLAGLGFVTYYQEYKAANNSIHGVEAGLFGALQKQGFWLGLMMILTPLLPNLAGLVSWAIGDISGFRITGPTSILILGITLAVGLVQQPAAMFIANLPPPPPDILNKVGLGIPAEAVSLSANAGHLLVAGFATLLAIPVALLVVICFAWVAVEWIVAIANIAIGLPARYFEMGWGAAPGTSPWARGFFNSVRAAAIRLFIIGVLASFIGLTVGHWGTMTAVAPGEPINLLAIIVSWLKLSAGSIVFFGLALRLPALASEASGGGPGGPTARDIVGLKK